METSSGIFSQFERDELNKITAKSILEKLMNIRQKINVEFTARRLVWELIQNAKDNVSLCNLNNEKVDIEIELLENQFIFSHNKGYFTNEHIRGLIRKYSSSDKNREAEDIGQTHKATGRFGTGFMTTHLLSEKVKIDSYYKNGNDSFNHFSFWLDRTGKGEAEIIKGINNAFTEAEKSIKSSQNKVIENENLNTSFSYPFVDKDRLAEIALSEVKKCVAFTLINVPEINSINLIEDVFEETKYKIELVDSSLFQETKILTYVLIIDNKKTENHYFSVTNSDVQIVIPALCTNGIYSIIPLEDSIPRLHLDFPMIGTEDLNLPFIINSSLFEPTEPRDGISLIHDDDNEISKLNCGLVVKAVNLYEIFLSYSETRKDWKNLYNLARLKPPKRHSWIDLSWFRDNVINILRAKLLKTTIVDIANNGRVSILNDEGEDQVYFPSSEKDIVREKIWKLMRKIHPQKTPVKDQINHWHQIIWNDCYKYSLLELSEEIQCKGNLENLANSLEGDAKDALEFLNEYFELLHIDQNYLTDINADKIIVIPNQKGYFTKKTELFIEKDIDEEIKNVCSLISTDPREYLINKEVRTGSEVKYYSKTQEDIITEINNVIKEDRHDLVSDACDYLTSLFPNNNGISKRRESIFNLSKRVFPDNISEKKKLYFPNEKIWIESDKRAIFYIVSRVAKCKTVKNATEELDFDNENEFLVWLDSFITFLIDEKFDNYINKEKYPILPNQMGDFSTKDNLFLDSGDIGNVLKSVSSELGYDFRPQLLEESIFLELPENRTYTIETVAEKISSLIKPILRDVDKRKLYKESLRKLYLWMNENRSKAEIYFSDLFEKRFLFLEDDDISSNMKKAEELDHLLEDHGINSVQDLRDKLTQLESNKNNSPEGNDEKVEITKEILVSLGISSPEELEVAFKDPLISNRFYHTSSSTSEMYIYAQKLIERAKDNIKQYLIAHPDYDCSDIEETAPTILAGIEKNGISIHVVTRPSDNGEVIIYYSSEKDTLDSVNAELWVDNGITDPHLLTLGRVIKSTGINRIPINMD